MLAARRNLLRDREPDGHGRVTFIELFFDLVFVFAVTQLSHALLANPGPVGAAQTLLLFIAIWWVWIFTSWTTNWLDPEHTPVRAMLLALMLGGLLLSASVPQAFQGRGLAFAGAYVAIQLSRSLFMLWALARQDHANLRNFQRITLWLSASAVLWLGGGLLDGWWRPALWFAALAAETAGPLLGFRTPGLGRSTTADWDVDGGHMAERCALFIIIALGESILATGATFAALEWNSGTIAAFLIAFAASLAMWWIYFDTGAKRGSHAFSQSDNPGRMARLAYTYIHPLMIAGIIVAAVGDEMVLAHPEAEPSLTTTVMLLAAPALYLLGNLLFKRTTAGHIPFSHMAGLGLLAVLAVATPRMPPLPLSATATLTLVVVAAWETLALRRGQPAPRDP